MTQERKRTLLLSILLCIVSISIINAALPLHTFENGKPFPSSNQIIHSQADTTTGSAADPVSTLFLKGSLSIILFFLASYFFFLVFRKTTWKQIARFSLIFLAVLLFIFVLSLITPQQVEISSAAQDAAMEIAPKFTYRTEPIQSPPIAWQWIAAAILFIIVGGGIAYFIFREPKQENLETKIAREAESAIQALQAGNDFRSVILYCYQEMSRVIQESENINREEAMTVREFENILGKTSLPMTSIQQLSRAFENVRYSKNEPSIEDQQLCLNSLRKIIDHCQTQGSVQ